MASRTLEAAAGFFSITAILLALWHIFMHLANYTEPTFQRYTVRIIFMVPPQVFAMMSFLSLLYQDAAIYFDSCTAIYEAFVIYNFLSLCLAWVGGPGAVVQSLQGRLLKPSWHLMTCCMAPIALDGFVVFRISSSDKAVKPLACDTVVLQVSHCRVFIRRCKQGGLQFVIIKPLLVVATFLLYALNLYDDGNFSATSGYLYITLIYTVSYSVALYVLVLFYVACSDLLRPFKALPKFIIIKSVVFLTYWQGVGIYIVAKMGYINSAEEAEDVQNFLVCFEMLLAAFGHVYAFPYQHYAESNISGSGNLSFLASAAHAMSLNDVVHDTFHQFAPTYHDYVLYSDGSQEAPTRYRTRTFVSTGQEMDTLRRHSKMFGAGTLDLGAASSRNPGYRSSGGASFSVPSFSFSEEPPGRRKSQTGSSFLMNQGQHQGFVADFMKPPLPALQSSTSFHLSPPSFHIRPPADGRSSMTDSRRSSSRRSSTTDDAETTLLGPGRRKSSHGVLLDEIDIHGEEDDEGYIQR